LVLHLGVGEGSTCTSTMTRKSSVRVEKSRRLYSSLLLNVRRESHWGQGGGIYCWIYCFLQSKIPDLKDHSGLNPGVLGCCRHHLRLLALHVIGGPSSLDEEVDGLLHMRWWCPCRLARRSHWRLFFSFFFFFLFLLSVVFFLFLFLFFLFIECSILNYSKCPPLCLCCRVFSDKLPSIAILAAIPFINEEW